MGCFFIYNLGNIPDVGCVADAVRLQIMITMFLMLL